MLRRAKISTDIEDIEQNIQQSKELPDGSVEIYSDSNLAYELEHDSFFILMYEMTCCPKPNEGPRFLATMGVFTCIALFARSDSGRAFAAHIPIGSCHCTLTDTTHPALEEVTVALQWVFRKEASKDSIQVSLVGGQEAQDNDKALHCRFSELVMKCIRRAGIQNIDTSLLNVFPGVPFSPTFEKDQAAKNQSFQLVALDRETGRVVVHTRSSKYGYYSVDALGQRNKIEMERYIRSLSTLNPRGQRCKHVKWM